MDYCLLPFGGERGFRFMGHVPEDVEGEPMGGPALDCLAAGATVFSDAYCRMPVCALRMSNASASPASLSRPARLDGFASGLRVLLGRKQW